MKQSNFQVVAIAIIIAFLLVATEISSTNAQNNTNNSTNTITEKLNKTTPLEMSNMSNITTPSGDINTYR